MKKISVAIASFNEEENIGKCLDSVKNWVDEIIVVDGNSSDKTADIARSKGAKVISVKNRANFHINKKMAIDKCQGEWIFQLDADEVVPESLKNEIVNVITNADANGYWIPRKNYFLGKFLTKGGQYPDYTIRLYKKGKGQLPAKNVHEQAIVYGKVGYLSQPLLHYSYPNFKHYLAHYKKYTDLFAKDLVGEKLKINLITIINYYLIKPTYWFLLTFFRHKGFIDGWRGFVFSFFSSLRFPVSYTKYWKNFRS